MIPSTIPTDHTAPVDYPDACPHCGLHDITPYATIRSGVEVIAGYCCPDCATDWRTSYFEDAGGRP